MYNAMLKRTEVKIDGTSFFIAPFPVFSAARITAMLSKVLAPVLGGLIALLGGEDSPGENGAVDADGDGGSNPEARKAVLIFTEAMSNISPEEFERLLRELLISSRNIAFRNEMQEEGEILTEEHLNAMFAGNSHNLYILAYHVLKVNFQGFFGKFASLSGSQFVQEMKAKFGSPDTEGSTQASLLNLS